MTVVARLRLVAALVALAAVTACGSVTPVYPDQNNIQYAQTDLTVGTGSTAAAGNTASVQYQLWLYSESGADHKGSLGLTRLDEIIGRGQGEDKD